MSAIVDALAAEQAALYVYGVLGAQAANPAQARRLRDAYDAHRDRRDQLLAFAHARDVTPPAGSVFPTPTGIDTATGIQAAAAATETSCLGPYAALVAAGGGELRRFAAAALSDCATRAIGFNALPTPLPGLEPA